MHFHISLSFDGNCHIKVFRFSYGIQKLPTAKECKRLNIENDEPMLEVEQIGYLDDGRPFEYSIARHAHGYEFLTISTH